MDSDEKGTGDSTANGNGDIDGKDGSNKGKGQKGSGKIDAPVSYSSKDSVVMMGNGNAFLQGS